MAAEDRVDLAHLEWRQHKQSLQTLTVLAEDKVAQANGATGAALDAYRPWLAAFLISMSPATNAGYRPDAGADKTLMDRARAEGKTLHGFETADIRVRLIAGRRLLKDQANAAASHAFGQPAAELGAY